MSVYRCEELKLHTEYGGDHIPLMITGTVTNDCAVARMGSAARLALVRRCILVIVEIWTREHRNNLVVAQECKV
jgi:hypothetical protein